MKGGQETFLRMFCSFDNVLFFLTLHNCDGSLYSHQQGANMQMNLLTIDQVSELLHIAKPTLYSWISAKKITCVKVGGRVRFRESDIDHFISEHLSEAI